MDGRVVPNITFGPVVVEAVRRHRRKPLNVHLMIEEPECYLAAFAEAGTDHLLIHAEASSTNSLHQSKPSARRPAWRSTPRALLS